jgi:DNA-directed RNA polymerase specialized sigma24 family protein
MRFYNHPQDNETDRIPNEEQSLTARLYQLYASRILSYLYRHVLSREDAEDILYEVFLAVLEQEQTLAVRNDDAQRAWLWVVARNKASDYHRSIHRRPAVSPLDREGQETPAIPSPGEEKNQLTL